MAYAINRAISVLTTYPIIPIAKDHQDLIEFFRMLLFETKKHSAYKPYTFLLRFP